MTPHQKQLQQLRKPNMSLAKRVIPCLDIQQGRVVKGVQFCQLRDAGNPVEIARRYNEEGADEITVLDITASHEGRENLYKTIESIANEVFIPLTVGGGISQCQHIQNLLNAGADKVSINTAAILNPDFIRVASEQFGSQCIVTAIDVKKVKNKHDSHHWEVYTHGGRKATGLNAIQWAKKVSDYGSGEILLTSMDKDGAKTGYDIEITKTISSMLSIPIIASGGAGCLEHLVEGIHVGLADAVLVSSLFHFNQYSISDVKKFLKSHNIDVNMDNIANYA